MVPRIGNLSTLAPPVLISPVEHIPCRRLYRTPLRPFGLPHTTSRRWDSHRLRTNAPNLVLPPHKGQLRESPRHSLQYLELILHVLLCRILFHEAVLANAYSPR